MRTVPKIVLLAGLAALSFGCRSSQPGFAAPRSMSTSALAADQANAPLLPDPKLTPGATLPVTRADISVPGYTQKVRNVPLDVKKQVYAEYGIVSHRPGDYEVDHLISLELGGSNSIKNLWPQSYKTQPWNAHVKDALENELHDEVCSGRLDLATAQHDIATDWIAAYKKYFHTNTPLSSAGGYTGGRRRRGRHPLTAADSPFPAPPAASFPAPGNSPATGTNAQVWVNLKSGKYFLPGSPYYGNTKQGQYMTEAQAQQQGYIAAKGQ
jgi:hypothetical protein